MNAHTPGPWVAVELPTAIAIKSHMGNVANIQRGSMRDQQQANARLIVAAPDLLEALKVCHLELHWCSKQLESEGWTTGSTVTKALKSGFAAISKATGEQP